MTDTPARIAESIRTAQSIAHHRLAELGDDSHAGVPRECHRPLCRRLLQDAAAVELLRGAARSMAELCEAVPEWDEPPFCSVGQHYFGAPCPAGLTHPSPA